MQATGRLGWMSLRNAGGCVALTLTHVRGLKITNRMWVQIFWGNFFFFAFWCFFFCFSFLHDELTQLSYHIEDKEKSWRFFLYRLNFFCLFCFSQEKNHYILCLFVCFVLIRVRPRSRDLVGYGWQIHHLLNHRKSCCWHCGDCLWG